jgi:hypothetical protein
MGTHCPFHIWLCQSVPSLVVYPPFDAPHMLTCRDTRHHRTQLIRNMSGREGSFGLIMLLFIMQIIRFRTVCLLPTTNSLTISHEASPYFLVKWGQDPHDLLLQTNIGRRMNFDCPSVPSGQNSIFPMRPGERDDGISTLRSHQYDLADEGVTEEIKRQTFSKHYFTPHRHKVLMRMKTHHEDESS